jgi:HTH-type transcriptional repressor of NAD biosynthesis genes
MNRFKVGMVLGKFYPFHNGHAYLIDMALARCDFVYVYVCTLPNDYYRGADRAAWIFEHYRNEYWNGQIKIIHVDEVLPQIPEEHPDFWTIWVNVVKSRADKPIEALFTSEDYGTPFAMHLGVEHVRVTERRKTVPISGTACRAHLYDEWEFLPVEVQNHFRKKICIIGPESTGKSTMTRMLAEHFNADYIEEYGREYATRIDPQEMTAADFVNIGYGQWLKEISAFPHARRLLFCDTDQLITRAFYRLYTTHFGAAQWDQVVDDYLKHLQESRGYTMYFLLTPEVPHVQDGQRDFGNPERRLEAYNTILRLVTESGVPFIRIKGSDFSDRFEQAVFWTNTVLETAR